MSFVVTKPATNRILYLSVFLIFLCKSPVTVFVNDPTASEILQFSKRVAKVYSLKRFICQRCIHLDAFLSRPLGNRQVCPPGEILLPVFFFFFQQKKKRSGRKRTKPNQTKQNPNLTKPNQAESNPSSETQGS